MKKLKLYWPFLPLVVFVAVAVVGWFVLPPEVIVQVGMDGRPSNTMPKLMGLLVPVAMSALGGSFMADQRRRLSGAVLLVVAAVVDVLLFAWNL